MEKLRRRLTLNERIVIETLLKENKTKSYIAKQLNRNRSTITREAKTWIKKPTDKYNVDDAHFFAYFTDKKRQHNYDYSKVIVNYQLSINN